MTDSKGTSLLPIAVAAFAFLALAGQASAGGPGAAKGSIVAKHGRLRRVKGNRIVDKNGQPVALHGMSLFWSQWMGQYYNAEAVKWLRDDWGCTVVRAAMAVESGGYLRNAKREKQKVFAVIQAAIDLGIYVIVDWHDHNAHRHTRQAKEFFAELAKVYGKYPNVIYETWNEPLRAHDWGKVIKPYHQAVIPVIRKHAPDSLIVCGTQTWSQDVDKAARDPLKYPNVAYALHFYAATHKQSLRDKAAAALKLGVAIMVTEWGTSEASGSGKLDYGETQKWLEFMDRHKLTWCNWSVADKRETSAALQPRASGKGGWPARDLTRSGTLLRKEIRSRLRIADSSPSRTGARMSGTDVESMATKRYRREKCVVAMEKGLLSTSNLTGGAVRNPWPAAQTPDLAYSTHRVGYNHCRAPATVAGRDVIQDAEGAAKRNIG